VDVTIAREKEETGKVEDEGTPADNRVPDELDNSVVRAVPRSRKRASRI